MIHRLTLVAGAFVATAIMSFAAGAQSTPPLAEPVAAVAAQDVLAAVASPMPAPTPAAQTVTDTVYVLPPLEPAVIHVTRQAPAATATARAPRTTAAPRHHERERDDEGESGESEGEGD